MDLDATIADLVRQRDAIRDRIDELLGEMRDHTDRVIRFGIAAQIHDLRVAEGRVGVRLARHQALKGVS